MQKTTLRQHTSHIPAYDHNARKKELIEKENAGVLKNEKDRWIDPDGNHEVMGPGQTLREAYEHLFGAAIDEYNRGQKRSDRKMTVDGYLQSVEDSRRGRPVTAIRHSNERARAQGRDKDIRKESGQRTSYEVILSLGNVKPLRGENGKVVIDPETGERVRPNYVPADVIKQVLQDYIAGWPDRNPNLYLYRADYHNDEWYRVTKGGKEISGLPGQWLQGESHGHLCFVPHAGGYKRGLKEQVSITRALAAQGHVDYQDATGRTVTAWEQWEQAERDVLKEIVARYGYEIVPADDSRESLSADEFAELADLQEAIGNARAELAETESRTADLQAREIAVADREQALDVREQALAVRERDAEAQRERLKVASDLYTAQLAEYGDLNDKLPKLRKQVKENEEKAEKARQDAEDASKKAVEWYDNARLMEREHAALAAKVAGLRDAMQADIDSQYPEMYRAAVNRAVAAAEQSPRVQSVRMLSGDGDPDQAEQAARDSFTGRYLDGR